MKELHARVAGEVRKVVVGQAAALEDMLAALALGGHVLLEGVPGTAKTLLASATARALGIDFRRLQFTPDMLPSDVTGTMALRAGELVFRPGPVFAGVVLADEINRTPPKTQAALLEAMQEGQVTVDGVSHALPDPFLVLATQNPVEYEGTYPLPEAQLDRFLLKIVIGYPAAEAERAILDRYAEGFSADRADTYGVTPVITSGELITLRRAAAAVHVEPNVRDYVTRIVRATREEPSFALGASPRAGVALFLASRAEALLSGRDFVTPDDVKSLALPVLRHRVLLTPEAEVEGQRVDDRLRGLLQTLPAPR